MHRTAGAPSAGGNQAEREGYYDKKGASRCSAEQVLGSPTLARQWLRAGRKSRTQKCLIKPCWSDKSRSLSQPPLPLLPLPLRCTTFMRSTSVRDCTMVYNTSSASDGRFISCPHHGLLIAGL